MYYTLSLSIGMFFTVTFFVLLHRSEFLKEKNRPKTVPPLNAGPSTAAAYSQTTMTSSGEGSSSSQHLQEPAPEASTPQIKPYTRKRPRDTSNEVPSESSKLSALSSSLSTVVEGEGRGGGEVGAMGLESAAVSLDVKPYVRKRKIKPKN